jgi:hypothetical protein
MSIADILQKPVKNPAVKQPGPDIPLQSGRKAL